MSYITGTAAGNNDFLDKLKAGLIANNWSLLVDQISTTRELYFQNSNTNVIIGFKVLNLIGSESKRNGITPIRIFFNSPTSYSSSFDFFNQVGSIPYDGRNGSFGQLKMPSIVSYDKSIRYHLFINDNRVVIVNKISTYYVAGYLGKFRQEASPATHPNAVYVGGSSSETNTIFDQDNANFSAFPFLSNRTANGANFYRDKTGAWKVVKNNETSTPTDSYQIPSFSSSTSYANFQDNEDGSITPVKIMIVGPNSFQGILDDVYIVFTQLANSQDTTNDGYMIFNNITKNETSSYFCVKK